MSDQQSLNEQLDTLITLANDAGLYDAIYWVILRREEEQKKIEEMRISIQKQLRTLK